MDETVNKFNALLNKTAATVPVTAKPAGLSNDAAPTETPNIPQPAFTPDGSQFTAAGKTNEPQKPPASPEAAIGGLQGLQDLQKADPLKAQEIQDSLLTATTGAEGLVTPQAAVSPAGGLKSYGHGVIPGTGKLVETTTESAALPAAPTATTAQTYMETPEQRQARHAQEELAIQAKQNQPPEQPGVLGRNYSVMNSALGLGNYLSEGMGTKWQEWYKNNPTIGNALGLGAIGLGAAGIAGLMSSAFGGDDEEDDRPRRRKSGGGFGKVLPWALGLGGLAAGGYALWKNKDALAGGVARSMNLPTWFANQSGEQMLNIAKDISDLVSQGKMSPAEAKGYEDRLRAATTKEARQAVLKEMAGKTGVDMATSYALDHPVDTAKRVGGAVLGRVKQWWNGQPQQTQGVPKKSSMDLSNAVGLGATTLGGAGAGYLVNRYLLGNKSKTSAILSALAGAGVGAVGYSALANSTAKQTAENRANKIISTGNADIRLSKTTPKEIEATLNAIKNGTSGLDENQQIDFLDANSKYFKSDYDPTGITTGWSGRRAAVDAASGALGAMGADKLVSQRNSNVANSKLTAAESVLKNTTNVPDATIRGAQANKAAATKALTRWNSNKARYTTGGVGAAVGVSLAELLQHWAQNQKIEDQKDVFKKSIYQGYR